MSSTPKRRFNKQKRSTYEAIKDPVVRYGMRYGHCFNPEMPSLLELADQSTAQLNKLKQGDRLYDRLARSVQQLDANLDDLCNLIHGRSTGVVADGDVGQATVALAGMSRCSVPDYSDPRNYSGAVDDPFSATGSGAWPINCDPKQPGIHGIRILLVTRGMNRFWREVIGHCQQEVIRVSADIGLGVRFLILGETDEDLEDVELFITFGSISGSTIGWNYLPQADTCRQVLDGKIDIGYQVDKVMSALLCIHEWVGHGAGCRHTNGGIMNPSIRRVPVMWIDHDGNYRDPGYSQLRRFYGGLPLEPVDPVPPTPEPPVGEYSIQVGDGVLHVVKNGIIVPGYEGVIVKKTW